MLTTSKELLEHALKEKYAVPAINTQGGTYDIIMAICKAAEAKKSPIILAHYVLTGQYSGDDWFAEVARWCAKRVSVPVAIHLDHGDSFELVARSLKYGFTSIMYDGSSLPVEENAKNTNEIIKMCHAFNVPVEAEIGRLLPSSLEGGKTAADNVVDIEDVKFFLSLCSPDSLAVGIGNAHGFYKGTPYIQLSILEQCRKITDIPLVLHGCTGIPDKTVKKAISLGVSKINFGTLVRHKYVEYLKEGIENLDHQGHIWKISQYASRKLEKVISDIIDLSESAGRA
ncbi:MAG: class II fructose-bisphosphate aldolase [Actinomycetota bacterium]|nr:class II fructose-bisphosphate aldolase [Actinomycetota bacterium]